MKQKIKKILKEETSRQEVLSNAQELLNSLPIDNHIESIEIKDFGLHRLNKHSCDIYVLVDEVLSSKKENSIRWEIEDTLKDYYPEFLDYFIIHHFIFDSNDFLYA